MKVPVFETHYELICPVCLQKCHSLYAIGHHPSDRLGCRNCALNAGEDIWLPPWDRKPVVDDLIGVENKEEE
jgi:hypothetical protein